MNLFRFAGPVAVLLLLAPAVIPDSSSCFAGWPSKRQTYVLGAPVYAQAPTYVYGQAPMATGYTFGAAPTVAYTTVAQAPSVYSFSYGAVATGSAPSANVLLAPRVGSAPNAQDSVVINGQVYRREGSSGGVGASPENPQMGAAPVNASVRAKFRQALQEDLEDLRAERLQDRNEYARYLLALALGVDEDSLTSEQADYAAREVRRLLSGSAEEDEPEGASTQDGNGQQPPQVLYYSAPVPQQPMVLAAPSVVPVQLYVPVVPSHKSGKFFGR